MLVLLARLDRLVDALWPRRGAQVAAAVLRLALGFALLPAGLKKVIGERFTDAGKTGPFHEFLHAFYATGGFYRAVGALQLVIALLLLTQRAAWLGATLAIPVLGAIVGLCWSTAVYPTATVATLMLLGVTGLALWDRPRPRPVPAPIDLIPWAVCGVVILGAYLTLCLASGEVYRPRKVAPADPAFWIMPAIALSPLGAWWAERRRRRPS